MTMKWMLAALCLAPSAFACLCTDSTLERAFSKSTAVFSAKVLSTSAGKHAGAVLQVLGVHKGTLAAGKTVHVATGGSSTACGVSFDSGHAYLVWATGPANDLRTHLCLPTKRMASAREDLAWLLSRAAAR